MVRYDTSSRSQTGNSGAEYPSRVETEDMIIVQTHSGNLWIHDKHSGEFLAHMNIRGGMHTKEQVIQYASIVHALPAVTEVQA